MGVIDLVRDEGWVMIHLTSPSAISIKSLRHRSEGEDQRQGQVDYVLIYGIPFRDGSWDGSRSWDWDSQFVDRTLFRVIDVMHNR